MKKCQLILVGLVFIASMVWADEDSCGPKGCPESTPAVVDIRDSEPAPQISYEEFVVLISSGKPFILLDTRPMESYLQGHIDGALSFSWSEINEETANRRLPSGVKIVVYCASAACNASATSAKKLKRYGYDVVDYHGGVREWMEKGNQLVK